jgi:hypothetical protein
MRLVCDGDGYWHAGYIQHAAHIFAHCTVWLGSTPPAILVVWWWSNRVVWLGGWCLMKVVVKRGMGSSECAAHPVPPPHLPHVGATLRGCGRHSSSHLGALSYAKPSVLRGVLEGWFYLYEGLDGEDYWCAGPIHHGTHMHAHGWVGLGATPLAILVVWWWSNRVVWWVGLVSGWICDQVVTEKPVLYATTLPMTSQCAHDAPWCRLGANRPF